MYIANALLRLTKENGPDNPKVVKFMQDVKKQLDDFIDYNLKGKITIGGLNYYRMQNQLASQDRAKWADAPATNLPPSMPPLPKERKPQPADGAEPFWDKIVDAYWHWYSENIVKDEKPDWKNNPSESKAMRELVKKLKSKVFEVMEKKNIDRDEAWNSDNAASYVIGFLTAAINYEAPKKVYWYKSNFSLRIINTKFTELYVALQEKNRSTGGKAAESNRAATNKNIDDLFAKGKNKQRGQV
jgi:hypothetical protein